MVQKVVKIDLSQIGGSEVKMVETLLHPIVCTHMYVCVCECMNVYVCNCV